MPLALHAEITRDEALSALGAKPGSPELDASTFLNGASVVLGSSIACFFDVAPDHARILTSTRFEWCQRKSPSSGAPKPRTLDEIRARFDEVWPKPVVDVVLERAGNQVIRRRHHEVFLRLPENAEYVYAGRADLGQRTMDGDATFTLGTRLPRELWLRFGGAPGWRCELAHAPSTLADADAEALTGLLDAFAAEPFSHLVLTRYEEDALHLFKNERCAFLMYLREPHDGGLYVDRGVSGAPAADERFSCDCGIALTYSVRHTVPIEDACAIARAFFATGHLPEDRTWTEDLEA